MKPARLEAPSDNFPALAARASQKMPIFFNDKDKCSIPILSAGVTIAVNPDTMVQYAVYMLLPHLSVDWSQYKGRGMSTFSFEKYA
jgi:hypothetical protein